LRPPALGASAPAAQTEPSAQVALGVPTEQALLALLAVAITYPEPTAPTEQALLAQRAVAITYPEPAAPTEQVLLVQVAVAITYPEPTAPTAQVRLAQLAAAIVQIALTARLATTAPPRLVRRGAIARLSRANASVTVPNSAPPLVAVAHGPVRAGKAARLQVARALTRPAAAMSVSTPRRLPNRSLAPLAARALRANPNVSRKCSPAWASHPVARRKTGFAPAASPSTVKSPCWAIASAAPITCASTAV
jgi:hypothetical protein